MSSPPLTSDLPERIKKRRQELFLSQREAAEKIGVSERTFQNWELGEAVPRPSHRRAVEVFLTDEGA